MAKSGLEIEIPGLGEFHINYLLLDLNGTISVDGQLVKGVKERLRALAKLVEIYVLTADTHGTVDQIFKKLPIKVFKIKGEYGSIQKLQFLQSLGEQKCIAIGNGQNDVLMLKYAALSIGIIGKEGAAFEALAQSDIVVHNIVDALDLLLKRNRIKATLRY